MLKSSLQPGSEAKPRKWFCFKMKLILRKKAWDMYWNKALTGTGKLKFAGLVGLVVLLTCGGSIAAYAYTSADVTVLHPLYPVKQGMESAELYFAINPQMRAEINLRHAKCRMAEMEKLNGQMQNSPQPQVEEDGFDRTMAMMQQHMQDSISSAAEDDESASAEQVIDSLHQNLQDMDNGLGVIAQDDQLMQEQMVRAQFDDLRQYTKNKLQRVEEVSLQIKSPMRIKGPHVFMRQLMEEQMDQDGFMPAMPVPSVSGTMGDIQKSGAVPQYPMANQLNFNPEQTQEQTSGPVDTLGNPLRLPAE